MTPPLPRFCLLAFSDSPLAPGAQPHWLASFDARAAVALDGQLLAAQGIDLFGAMQIERMAGASQLARLIAQGLPIAGFQFTTISLPGALGVALGFYPRPPTAGFSGQCAQQALRRWPSCDAIEVPLGPWRDTFDADGFATSTLEDFVFSHWLRGRDARLTAMELDQAAHPAQPRAKPSSL